MDGLNLLNAIHVVNTSADETVLIAQLLNSTKPTILAFLNQHAFNLASENPAFSSDLGRADVLLRDGVGIEIALKLFARSPGKNCAGTDLIPRILAAAGLKTVAVFGTSEQWLNRAVEKLSLEGVTIVVALDGFQKDDRYIDAVAKTAPDIVLLAMGMPRQEALAARLATLALAPRLIINGGAILDFYAERFARAPMWMQACRLEWLFRLWLEPRRLAGRYLWGGATFAWRILALRAQR